VSLDAQLFLMSYLAISFHLVSLLALLRVGGLVRFCH